MMMNTHDDTLEIALPEVDELVDIGLAARVILYNDEEHTFDEVIQQMSGKKIGLLCSSEETYPGATLGMVPQIQEYSRYTQSEFMGVVRGIGNKRTSARGTSQRINSSNHCCGWSPGTNHASPRAVVAEFRMS